MRIINTLFVVVLAAFTVDAQRILASNEFEADNVNSVYIKGSFCDVIIKPGNKVYFNGIIEGSGDEEDYDIISDIRGSELYIRIEKSTRSWDRISRAELNLTIPDGVVIRVDNSSGDIFAERISSSLFEFETSSGDIELSDIIGELQLESTSGDIDLRNFKGNTYSESTSGNLELSGVDGDIETRSTSGDIEVRDLTGDLTASSTSGDIDLRAVRGRIELRSTSGDIEGYGIELTGDAEFRASSGDIEMDLLNDMNDLSFDLQTSSGSLRVGGRSGDKNIYIKRGGYWIKGVTSSGNMKFGN